MASDLHSDRVAGSSAKPSGGTGYRKLAAQNAARKAAAEARLGQKFIDTLFAEGVRHKALHGGRGSAKSWSVATYLPIRASQSRKRIVCARQFQNSIRDSSKELIEKRIRSLGMSNQFTITDRYITHDGTLSQFIFVGLERNVESIRSLEGADIVWIEEAKTISAKSMEILLPTVRAAGSELIWTWNPDKPTDPVDAYFRKGEPPPRSIVTEVSYRDNPFFENTEMPGEMQVLKDGNFARYEHVWQGKYDVSYETKVFTNVRIGRPDLPAKYAALLRHGLRLRQRSFFRRQAVRHPREKADLHRQRGQRPRHHGSAAAHGPLCHPRGRRPGAL